MIGITAYPTDTFDRKLCLFHERCDQAGVNDEEKHCAFSIMLSNLARDFYYENIREKVFSFIQITVAVRRRCITAAYEINLVREWDCLSLSGIIAKNAGNPRTFCTEGLVCCMHTLQSCLPDAYDNDEIFRNKLLNALKDVETCKFAYFKLVETVEGLISDLHSSLAIETSTPPSAAVDAHLVDRKFRVQRGRLPYPNPNITNCDALFA